MNFYYVKRDQTKYKPTFYGLTDRSIYGDLEFIAFTFFKWNNQSRNMN